MQLRFFEYENSKELRVVGRKRCTFKWLIPRRLAQEITLIIIILIVLTIFFRSRIFIYLKEINNRESRSKETNYKFMH